MFDHCELRGGGDVLTEMDGRRLLLRLHPYNLAAATLHAAQAAIAAVFANTFSLPVRASYMTGPPGPGAAG
ncbi:MAG: hypothetical protein ACYCSX_18045 [Acidimicrobiales bacterium]